MGTENTTVDYENFIIRTTVQNCADIKSILSVSETAIAVPVASYIYGDIELYGTGTIVAVFDGDDYIGDFTLVVAGDTNGDSVCDALDCVNVERTANSNAQLSGVYTMAADSNYDDVVDISDYLEQKLEALNFYHSQVSDFPDLRSLEAIEALAKFRGATVNVRAAEAFMLVREIVR